MTIPRLTATFGLIILGLLLLGSPVDAYAQETPSALATAEKLIEAFNQHDPEAMAKLVSDDFELYYFDDEGIAGLALEGPDQLVAEMTAYFSAQPEVRSQIADAIDGPTFVSFREQIVREDGKGQSSIAVYEVRDGLIQRTWYYPAE